MDYNEFNSKVQYISQTLMREIYSTDIEDVPIICLTRDFRNELPGYSLLHCKFLAEDIKKNGLACAKHSHYDYYLKDIADKQSARHDYVMHIRALSMANHSKLMDFMTANNISYVMNRF